MGTRRGRRLGLGVRSLRTALVAGSTVLLLLAFQWWGELVMKMPGESAVEDVLTDAPGLALVFAPPTFAGLAFTLASFALGVESLIRRGGGRERRGVGSRL